jgi:hypothetical protein
MLLIRGYVMDHAIAGKPKSLSLFRRQEDRFWPLAALFFKPSELSPASRSFSRKCLLRDAAAEVVSTTRIRIGGEVFCCEGDTSAIGPLVP